MPSVKNTPKYSGPTLFTEEFAAPWENLACDEALLEECENSSESRGFLRFWQSKEYFVVLGYSRKLEEEIYRHSCESLGISIQRRCSGGGTVLQGPGCLNYALILPIDSAPELNSVTGANRYIMGRIRSTLAKVISSPVSIQGDTDLTLGDRKFSGNSQRRKRRCLLFHGSFLLNFDLSLISQTLRAPAAQPPYRLHRGHEDFLSNVNLNGKEVMQALRFEWEAAEAGANGPAIRARMAELYKTRYGESEWIHRC
jgi:lipoate-protein ligase A